MAQDINYRGDSGTTTREWRTGDQKLPTPNASTPGRDSGDASERNRLLLLDLMSINHSPFR